MEAPRVAPKVGGIVGGVLGLGGDWGMGMWIFFLEKVWYVFWICIAM
jgi:hypothetical protein